MNRYITLAVAALFCSGAAIAQGTSGGAGASGGGSSTGAGSTAGSGGGSSGGSASSRSTTGGSTAGTSGSSKAGGSASMTRADSKMMTDLAEANIAEIQTGKLALEKAQTQEAKTFAQKMIDDHTAALSKMQTLAQSKGVKLPADTDAQHKATAKALSALKGNTFDAQYLKRVGVNDHQRTVQLLQKAQKNAKDPDLKALATEMLPTVQQHLQMAQQQTSSSTAKK